MEAEGREEAKRTRLEEEEGNVDVVTEGSGEKEAVTQECRAGMYDVVGALILLQASFLDVFSYDVPSQSIRAMGKWIFF